MNVYTAVCCVCGDPMDYCQGHGQIGDPAGWAIENKHLEDDNHTDCHPNSDCRSHANRERGPS
jgi:hypothetical protein